MIDMYTYKELYLILKILQAEADKYACVLVINMCNSCLYTDTIPNRTSVITTHTSTERMLKYGH